MSQTVIFNNPRAGSPISPGVLDDIALEIEGCGGDVIVVQHEGKDEALAQLAEYLPQSSHVYALGGDGTIGLVAKTIIDSGYPVTLATLPAGTGNDFTNYLGLDRNPLNAVRQLISGDRQEIDYGKVTWTEEGNEERFNSIFLNSFGIGFDASIAIHVDRYKKLGSASYVMAGVHALGRWQNVRGNVTVDGESIGPEDFMFIAVCNGKSSGGGFVLAPDASISDGRLNVFIAGDIGRAQALLLLPQIRLTSRTGSSKVSRRAAKEVVISFTSGMPIHLDGEVLSRSVDNIQIECIAASLSILVPKSI